MTLARHIALLLAAAILAITVGVMPSVAMAHTGHAAPVELGALADARSPAEGAHFSTTFDRQHSLAIALPAATDGWKSEDRTGCAGATCLPGAHCASCCCAIALAPAIERAAPPPPTVTPERRRDPPDRAGIDPEALPEPPRPNV